MWSKGPIDNELKSCLIVKTQIMEHNLVTR